MQTDKRQGGVISGPREYEGNPPRRNSARTAGILRGRCCGARAINSAAGTRGGGLVRIARGARVRAIYGASGASHTFTDGQMGDILKDYESTSDLDKNGILSGRNQLISSLFFENKQIDVDKVDFPKKD